MGRDDKLHLMVENFARKISMLMNFLCCKTLYWHFFVHDWQQFVCCFVMYYELFFLIKLMFLMILLFDNDNDRYIVIVAKMCFWNMVSFLNGGIC